MQNRVWAVEKWVFVGVKVGDDPDIHFADHPGDALPSSPRSTSSRGPGEPWAPWRRNACRPCAASRPSRASARRPASRVAGCPTARSSSLLSNLEIQSFGSRDEQEVAGYAQLMETVFASWAEITVTENHIKQLHRDLLRFSDKDERHRGAVQDGLQQRRGLRCRRQSGRCRVRDRESVRDPAAHGRAGGLARSGSAGRAASPHRDRHLRRRLSGDPSVPRWQRAPEPGADHAAPAAGRLCLRPLQLAGERDRAEQGGLLPGAAPYPGDHPHRGTGLDALADLLPKGPATPDASSAREGRARATAARQAAGPGHPDPGPRPRSRPHHRRRRGRPSPAPAATR